MTTALVADDEAHLRKLIGVALQDWGFQVIEAENGAEALKMAAAYSPDIILLDVSMPVLDGFGVLKKLREAPETRAVPVIMMTTLPAEQGEHASMTLGVAHYVNKPCNLDFLKSTIKVALRDSEMAKQNEANPVKASGPAIAQAANAEPEPSSGKKPKLVRKNAPKGRWRRWLESGGGSGAA